MAPKVTTCFEGDDQLFGMDKYDDRLFDEKVLPFIERVVSAALKSLIKIAPIIAKLSKGQFRKVKKALKGRVTSDHLERIFDYGRDMLPEYLALPDKTIRASTWRKLRESIRRSLWDGDAICNIQYRGGPKPVALKNFTRFEWYIALDETLGLRSLDDQRKAYFQSTRKPTRAEVAAAKDRTRSKGVIRAEKDGVLVHLGEDGSAIEFSVKWMQKMIDMFKVA